MKYVIYFYENKFWVLYCAPGPASLHTGPSLIALPSECCSIRGAIPIDNVSVTGLSFFMWSIIECAEDIQPTLFRMNCPVYRYRFSVSMGQVSSRSSKFVILDGQGGLACCRPWSRKELDTTEWLNWTELKSVIFFIYFTELCSFQELGI